VRRSPVEGDLPTVLDAWTLYQVAMDLPDGNRDAAFLFG
jgi:hypothetical protein